MLIVGYELPSMSATDGVLKLPNALSMIDAPPQMLVSLLEMPTLLQEKQASTVIDTVACFTLVFNLIFRLLYHILIDVRHTRLSINYGSQATEKQSQ
jgi:hypothetical protein